MDINTHSTLKTNLASNWTLDTNFNDSRTGAHHGTFYNTPTFPVAKLRTGAKFVAASSQYGKVTNHADFLGATMTFAFWFKVDALPASTQWLLGHSQGGTLNRNVQLDSGGTVYVTFPDAVLPVTVPSMAPIVAGQWYHLLAFQGGGVVAFYLNNVDQGTIPSFTPAGVSADIYLGSNPTPGQYFNGIIDDFVWWNKILSSDDLFFGKAGCSQCHVGPNFTDSKFHNLGVGWDPKAKKFADEGRYLVTKLEGDKGAFKTPTLRDIALHAPYLHDGSAATLKDVVELYDQGGHPNPYLDAKVKKLNLEDADAAALVKFLEALTGESPKQTAPAAFPR